MYSIKCRFFANGLLLLCAFTMKFAIIFLVALVFHLLYTNVEPIKLEHHKVVIINVNRQYANNLAVETITNTKGERAFDATFTLKQDLHPKNVMLSIRAYIDRGNNKVIKAPFKMNANICDAFAKNQLNLQTIFDSSNITACPIKAGSYFIHNWKLDNKALPAIPPGKYQCDLTFLIDNVEYATIRWFGIECCGQFWYMNLDVNLKLGIKHSCKTIHEMYKNIFFKQQYR